MKKIVALLLVLLMVVSLAACSKPQQPSTPDTQKTDAPASESTSTDAQNTEESKDLEGEITFWHSFTQGPRMEKIQAAADAFMAEHPKVKITIETVLMGGLLHQVDDRPLPIRNVPDISSTVASQLVEMIDAEAVRPVDNLIDEIGRDRFMGNALTEMTAEDGNCYGVPLYLNTEAMWYRKDLLEKYDLDVPTTWEEMYEAAKIITDGENGEVYGAAMPMGTNDLLATRWLHLYVRSAGETLITEDGKANLTSQTALDGINYWVKVYKDCSPADAMNYNTLDEATLYIRANSASTLILASISAVLKRTAPDLMEYIDCAPIPSCKMKGDPEVGL